jgi:hypothetical protein
VPIPVSTKRREKKPETGSLRRIAVTFGVTEGGELTYEAQDEQDWIGEHSIVNSIQCMMVVCCMVLV